MRLIYCQLNNYFMKRPITHDYSDPSSSLGVSDKDLGTNSQTVIYREIPSATQAITQISNIKDIHVHCKPRLHDLVLARAWPPRCTTSPLGLRTHGTCC